MIKFWKIMIPTMKICALLNILIIFLFVALNNHTAAILMFLNMLVCIFSIYLGRFVLKMKKIK